MGDDLVLRRRTGSVKDGSRRMDEPGKVTERAGRPARREVRGDRCGKSGRRLS